MAAIAQQSKIEQLNIFVIESIRDACARMLDWAPETGPRIPDATPQSFGLKEVNGCIGFGRRMTGSTFFSCSEKLTEITNMVSGDMKRRTTELGFNGLLAPPLIMPGGQHRGGVQRCSHCGRQSFPYP